MIKNEKPKIHTLLFLFLYLTFLLTSLTVHASEISGTVSTNLSSSGKHYSEISGTISTGNAGNSTSNAGTLNAVVVGPPSTKTSSSGSGGNTSSGSGFARSSSSGISSNSFTPSPPLFGPILAFAASPSSNDVSSNYLTYVPPSDLQTIVSDNVSGDGEFTTPFLPDTGDSSSNQNSLTAAAADSGMNMSLLIILAIFGIILLASIAYAISRPGSTR